MNPDRSRLFSLLTEACELEHGLACSYMYTAFSLKKQYREGGLSSRQLLLNKKWAADIFFVASQEMLHLAQVWNILAAIGGNPYYFRPSFPQPAKYYPMGVPLSLQPFCEASIKRFILYERPADLCVAHCPASELNGRCESGKTVGELYEEIKQLICAFDEEDLFIGVLSRQVGESLIDFPHVIKIRGQEDAVRAIDMITHQGEGTDVNRENSHYQTFVNIYHEYVAEKAGNTDYSPIRDVTENPVTRIIGGVNPAGVNLIQAKDAVMVCDIFDDVYEIMMRMLSYVFVHTSSEKSVVDGFAHNAIQLMTTVSKPLGEITTQLPAGINNKPERLAGPPFRLSRHVSLPPNPAVARIIAKERLHQIRGALASVHATLDGSLNLDAPLTNLDKILSHFES